MYVNLYPIIIRYVLSKNGYDKRTATFIFRVPYNLTLEFSNIFRYNVFYLGASLCIV